jgi:ribosome-binding factor A
MPQRMKKLNELIRQQLGKIIAKDIEFPENLLVTITRVQTSADMKEAKIFFTAIPEKMRSTALKTLKTAAGNLSRQIGKILKTKFTPKLIFLIDEQEMFASGVEKILDELKKK